MQLQVNGKMVSFSDSIQNVQDVLKQYDLDPSFVIVELNKNIIAKEAFEQTPIFNHDSIEIVHFVGGG